MTEFRKFLFYLLLPVFPLIFYSTFLKFQINIEKSNLQRIERSQSLRIESVLFSMRK